MPSVTTTTHSASDHAYNNQDDDYRCRKCNQHFTSRDLLAWHMMDNAGSTECHAARNDSPIVDQSDEPVETPLLTNPTLQPACIKPIVYWASWIQGMQRLLATSTTLSNTPPTTTLVNDAIQLTVNSLGDKQQREERRVIEEGGQSNLSIAVERSNSAPTPTRAVGETRKPIVTNWRHQFKTELESGHDVVHVNPNLQSIGKRRFVDQPAPPSSDHVKVARSSNQRTPRVQSHAYAYRCRLCRIGFEEATLYSLHMGLHCVDEVWKCNMCGRQCVDLYDFTVHALHY